MNGEPIPTALQAAKRGGQENKNGENVPPRATSKTSATPFVVMSKAVNEYVNGIEKNEACNSSYLVKDKMATKAEVEETAGSDADIDTSKETTEGPASAKKKRKAKSPERDEAGNTVPKVKKQRARKAPVLDEHGNPVPAKPGRKPAASKVTAKSGQLGNGNASDHPNNKKYYPFYNLVAGKLILGDSSCQYDMPDPTTPVSMNPYLPNIAPSYDADGNLIIQPVKPSQVLRSTHTPPPMTPVSIKGSGRKSAAVKVDKDGNPVPKRVRKTKAQKEAEEAAKSAQQAVDEAVVAHHDALMKGVDVVFKASQKSGNGIGTDTVIEPEAEAAVDVAQAAENLTALEAQVKELASEIKELASDMGADEGRLHAYNYDGDEEVV